MTDETPTSASPATIKVNEEIEVQVDEESFEPKDYFNLVKNSTQKATAKMFEEQLATIADLLIRAKEVGQVGFTQKLAFSYDTILKEQQLLANGVDTYVLQPDMLKFLDKVKDVKIIEIQRYPRAIPIENMEAIQQAKNLKIFTNFLVVYTDLSGEDPTTPEEKAKVARNRDPIVFGYFAHEKKSSIRHDRFYFITDWEDEFCDLTFSKMVSKMATLGINENAAKKISTDGAYLQEIVRESLEELDKDTDVRLTASSKQHNKSFWKRFKSLWTSS